MYFIYILNENQKRSIIKLIKNLDIITYRILILDIYHDKVIFYGEDNNFLCPTINYFPMRFSSIRNNQTWTTIPDLNPYKLTI